MHNLDWDNVRHFLEVVRSGSLTQAAERLGVNQTTVSRRISALEERLGTRLFERAGNGWVITPMGECLVTSAERMAEEAMTIERHVFAESQELSGKLRITIADVCTQFLVMPTIEAYARQYPQVQLEIIATNDELDLSTREADIALRSTDTPPPNLVGKRICRIAYAIYGTAELQTRVNRATDNSDIPCITWLGDGLTRAPWIEKSFPDTQHVYRTNQLGVMLQMARLGVGIAQVPCAVGDTDPLLRRIPADYVEPGWGLWVLSHVDLRTTARVRVFRDLLVEALEQQRALIEGRSAKFV